MEIMVKKLTEWCNYHDINVNFGKLVYAYNNTPTQMEGLQVQSKIIKSIGNNEEI